MKYRMLGKTGLRVSEVGFGCGNVGGLLVRGSYADQTQGVRRAIELGINYFDTAPAYGEGRSETNLGRVLKQLNAEVSVATKVRIGEKDLNDISGGVQRSLEASLARLGRFQVDVLQLHTPIAAERNKTDWPGAVSVKDVLGRNGIADAFDAVRSRNLARFIGFTGIGETSALRRVIESGRFDVMQAYYNLLNPSAGHAVPAGFTGYDFGRIIDLAMKHQLGIAVIRVLAGGALGGAKARSGYASPSIGGAIIPRADYQSDEAIARNLSFLLKGDVASIPEAAIRFTLMHPGVSTVLVGFSDSEQIEEAASCSGKGPLNTDVTKALKKIWSSTSQQV